MVAGVAFVASVCSQTKYVGIISLIMSIAGLILGTVDLNSATRLKGTLWPYIVAMLVSTIAIGVTCAHGLSS